MSKPLRVAVVGTGYFSQFHFDAWSRCPEVEVVGLASLDGEAAKAVGEQFNIPSVHESLPTMLDDLRPDVLDIVTPPPTHKEFISEAARRGIDVVCQKPFCGTLDEATAAGKIAHDAGITVAVHENFRFQPWYSAICDLISGGKIGRPYCANFRLRPGDGQGPHAYLERQPYFQTMERFLIHETLIHHIDVARSMFGDPASIFADTVRLNPAITGEDSAVLLLGYDAGLRVVIDGNRLSDHKAKNRRRTMGEVLIEGELGTISLNGDGEILFRAHGSNDEEAIEYDWNDHGFGADCVYLFTRHVVDHFVNQTPLQNRADEYLTNLRIEEAAYESAQKHQRIDLV